MIAELGPTEDGRNLEGGVVKFREDALRIFISGLKRNLTDVLFAAKPKDMPSALALAQEVESNRPP